MYTGTLFNEQLFVATPCQLIYHTVPLLPELNASYFAEDCSSPQFKRLHNCDHNLPLAVVNIWGCKHHSVSYVRCQRFKVVCSVYHPYVWRKTCRK